MRRKQHGTDRDNCCRDEAGRCGLVGGQCGGIPGSIRRPNGQFIVRRCACRISGRQRDISSGKCRITQHERRHDGYHGPEAGGGDGETRWPG